MNIGDLTTDALYVGDEQAVAAYCGTDLVFGGGAIDYAKEYFTLEILSGGTISWNITGTRDNLAPLVYYSFDKTNWTPMPTSGETVFNVNAGDIVRFKGDNDAISYADRDSSRFSNSTAHFNAYGNIMSFIHSTNFEGTNLVGSADWKGLFRFCCLHSAKNLIVPSECATEFTFRSTFSECEYLTEIPDSISAITQIKNYTFLNAFEKCTSLTGVTLPSASYANYTRAFEYAFSGCTNLCYIKSLTTNPGSALVTSNWVKGVAANGTFVKKSGVFWSSGTSGIPSGWTVQDAS